VNVHLDDEELAARPATGRALGVDEWVGTGRELFAGLRATVGPATQGASVFHPQPA
jgi:phosphogluconate dehydratase